MEQRLLAENLVNDSSILQPNEEVVKMGLVMKESSWSIVG